MRIAIFSDLHLGFHEGGERQQESFDNARQAFEVACRQNPDLILMAGDIFDMPLPSPETLLKAFDIFSIARHKPKSGAKVFVEQKGVRKEFGFEGIPVITIHGTHEYRSIGQTNILELFDLSGYMVYLKMNKAFVEMNGETVCVHGFSGVPEKKSLDVLRLLNPVAAGGATNILVMHQSITEFLPFSDEMTATISLANLPRDFDLVVNGHLHWTSMQDLDRMVFLLTGSTVTTQMKKLEGEKPKGVFIFDSKKKSFDFFELPVQRKLFYHKIRFDGAKPAEIIQKARELVGQAALNGGALVPLVRLKFGGNLAQGFNSVDIDFNELKKEFEGKAIISFSKEFFSGSFKKKIGELRDIHVSKQSVSSIGLDLLEKNLEKTDFKHSFDVRHVFELLAQDKVDEALLLVQKQK